MPIVEVKKADIMKSPLIPIGFSFNIVCIIGDYGGGVQFLQAANASEKFNQSKIKIEVTI